MPRLSRYQLDVPFKDVLSFCSETQSKIDQDEPVRFTKPGLRATVDNDLDLYRLSQSNTEHIFKRSLEISPHSYRWLSTCRSESRRLCLHTHIQFRKCRVFSSARKFLISSRFIIRFLCKPSSVLAESLWVRILLTRPQSFVMPLRLRWPSLSSLSRSCFETSNSLQLLWEYLGSVSSSRTTEIQMCRVR